MHIFHVVPKQKLCLLFLNIILTLKMYFNDVDERACIRYISRLVLQGGAAGVCENKLTSRIIFILLSSFFCVCVIISKKIDLLFILGCFFPYILEVMK